MLLPRLVECIVCCWAMTLNPDHVCSGCAGSAYDPKDGDDEPPPKAFYGNRSAAAMENLLFARQALGRRDGERMTEGFKVGGGHALGDL